MWRLLLEVHLHGTLTGTMAWLKRVLSRTAATSRIRA
jgi:hypothetical protein